MIKKSIIVLSALAGLAAAIPMVPAAEAQSRRAYCDDYARRQAYRDGGDAGQVVGGAIGGAALGGIVGAVTGQGHASNVGTGAAIGGVTGGVLGATAGNHYDRGAYDDAFSRCMDRGGRVYGSGYYDNGARPYHRRGNAAIQYCVDRYRSYNPDTGLYLSTSGAYRHCP